jgi:tetratricopeptide (TPR) repeat protein
MKGTKLILLVSFFFSFGNLTNQDAQSYFDHGMKSLQAKDYIQAIGDFTNAVSVRANYSEAYYYRGKAKILLGQEMGFVNSEACSDFVMAMRYGNKESSEQLEINCTGECFDLKLALQEPEIVYCGDFSSSVLSDIPNKVIELKNIVKLNLFNNKLAKFPETISSLYSLIILDLSSNNISEISPSIAKLTNLKELNLNKNKLHELPYEFGNLENLRLLNLRSNYITEIPKSISRLKKLEVLDLSLNKISVVPLEIGNLKNPKELNLVGNEIPKEKRDILVKLLPNTKIYFE